MPQICVSLTERAPSFFFILMIWVELLWILKNIFETTDAFSDVKKVFIYILLEYENLL